MTDASQGASLAHYGVLRRSGRYPWGSGGPEHASNKSFLGYVAHLRAQGMSDPEIAKGMGITTTQLRAAKSIARNEERQALINQAQRLKDKGWSNVAIAQRLDVGESQVRALLQPGVKDRSDVLAATTDMLKEQVDKKKIVDVGSGVENHLAISATKLSTAVAALEEQGYKKYYVKVRQLGTGKYTTTKVLVPPGTPYAEVLRNKGNIQQIRSYSQDGGRSYTMIQEPMSISSKRVAVRYAEDGGTDADGVIYVRPGVKDTNLGKSNYAQVRIAVDGSHYLKGMAMYKDNLPPGVDLMFNTNKSKKSENKLDAMKEMKNDPENPFGATVRQRVNPKTGKVNSVMNIVNEEGDWTKWSKNLSTQLLSKQSPTLAREQLEVTREKKQAEFDEINRLTNPVVKRKLMESLADTLDSSAVHLKAAALPRQSSSVILPINTLKDNEVYAPNYRNGERVVLVRYPHGGIFEIPELTVNNRHPDARKALGQAKDAIGINSRVAERLSGADFDGDTVLVIPNNKGKVKTAPALEGLKGFDPQRAYPSYDGMKRMTPRAKQIEMGLVSNLITDMTIRGATQDELARAVRHSMVVIDAEKHNLNYRQSAIDNGISQLKNKYQGSSRAGASTLVSRATSTVHVEEKKARSAKEGGAVDKATGKKVLVSTGETYTNKAGKLVKRTTETQRLAATDDAHTLSSGTTIERVYADHSNKLKALANEARKIAVNTKPKPYSPAAKAAYEAEVKTLRAKLDIAKRNRPLERQAQLIANAAVQAKVDANPGMEKSEIKKIQQQQLLVARARTGAGKKRIAITDEEWRAIQAGAISTHTLSEILANADLDRVKELATPRTPIVMTSVKTARARSMQAQGYTQAEIADQLGVSLSTLNATI